MSKTITEPKDKVRPRGFEEAWRNYIELSKNLPLELVKRYMGGVYLRHATLRCPWMRAY